MIISKNKYMKNTKRFLTVLSVSILLFSISGIAQAAIIFQDDNFNDIVSPGLQLDSNGAGAVNTSIRFGADTVPTENGNITWDITSNSFKFDHSVDITGGLSATGNVDFSNATQFIMRKGTANPATCTEGEIYYNTTNHSLYTCTAANTWSSTGTQDFESVYNADADKTLTTSNGNYTIAPGTGNFNVTGTGGISFAAATFNLNTTGAFSANSAGNSNLTTDTGNLNLATTTSGDVKLSSAGNIIFSDSKLLSPVQLTNTATGIDAAYGTNGIIDALNTLTSTSAGDGASNVGVNDAGGYYTSTNVEGSLQEIGSSLNAVSGNNDQLVFKPEYPDAVVDGDGTNNKGKLESLYDATNKKSYYKFTTQQASAQDLDVKFRFALPTDFVNSGNLTFDYLTNTATNTDNSVDLTLKDVTTGTVCATSTSNAATTWTTVTITASAITTGCAALTPGDIMGVTAHLVDDGSSSANFADVGGVALAYTH